MTATDNPFISDIARGEQTAVLAWRHWLEERAEWGDAAAKARLEFCEVQEELEREPRFEPPQHYECDVCGNVPDENGELVHGKGCYVVDEDGGGSEWVGSRAKWISLTNRRDVLLCENEATWRASGPCEVCGTRKKPGRAQYDDPEALRTGAWQTGGNCPHCFGTGDRGGLCQRKWAAEMRQEKFGTDPWMHKVHWRAGLPYAVECRLEDMLERVPVDCQYCKSRRSKHWSAVPLRQCAVCNAHQLYEWRATQWAKSVVRWHPVERFVLADRMSEQWEMGKWFVWYKETQPWTPRPNTELAAVLFDLLRGGDLHTARESRGYPTREVANDALATAAGVLVRRAVWGES